ncbi:hypothetical protein D3C80_1935640 [compost metagenome]
MRHGAEQTSITPTLGEMLVDDGVPQQSQSRRHMQLADAIGFFGRSLHKHGLAHDGGAGRGAGDQAAPLIQTPDAPFDRSVSNLAG